MRVTALIKTLHKDKTMQFNVHFGYNDTLYSDDLIEWARAQTDRLADYVVIFAKGKKKAYYYF